MAHTILEVKKSEDRQHLTSGLRVQLRHRDGVGLGGQTAKQSSTQISNTSAVD